jgi:hypothetical protein
VTLYMDRRMRLVVTGHHDETLAEVTLRWADRDFDAIGLRLCREPDAEPYTFATLDFSFRDRAGTLREPVGPFPAGERVVLRCLATIGDDMHYRALNAEGPEIAIPLDALALDPA